MHASGGIALIVAVRSTFICGVVASLVGCAAAPVQEIKHFKEALAAVNTVQQPLLDELAVSERAQGRAIADRRSGKAGTTARACPKESNVTPQWQGSAAEGVADNICPSEAAYYLEDVDPPATSSFRRSLRVVGEYADLILALAEGNGAESTIGGAIALAAEVESISVVAEVALPAISAGLTALKPALLQIAMTQSKEEAIQSILRNGDRVTALIASLRAALPVMMNTAVAEDVSVITRNLPEASQAVKNIERTRLAVAGSIVMLGSLQAAWDATIRAARSPRRELEDVINNAAEVRATAEAVRKNLAELRGSR